MGAKDKVIEHVDDVVGVVFVLLPEMLQDPNFFLSLSVESFLVTDHFQRYVQMAFVIVSLHHLTKATLAYNFEHFIAIS